MYEYTPQSSAVTPANYNFGIAPPDTETYTPYSLGSNQDLQLNKGYGGLPSQMGQQGGSSGWFGIDGLGANVDTLKLGLGGLQTVGNLWAAFQAQNLAKKQFNFTKDITNTNLANQIQSYNTSLADRSRSRAAVEGQSQAQAQAYIDQNSLKR